MRALTFTAHVSARAGSFPVSYARAYIGRHALNFHFQALLSSALSNNTIYSSIVKTSLSEVQPIAINPITAAAIMPINAAGAVRRINSIVGTFSERIMPIGFTGLHTQPAPHAIITRKQISG